VLDAKYLETKGWLTRVVSENEFQQVDVLLNSYISKSYEQMFILKKQFNENRTSLNLFINMTKEVKQTARLWGSSEHKKAVGKFLTRK